MTGFRRRRSRNDTKIGNCFTNWSRKWTGTRLQFGLDLLAPGSSFLRELFLHALKKTIVTNQLALRLSFLPSAPAKRQTHRQSPSLYFARRSLWNLVDDEDFDRTFERRDFGSARRDEVLLCRRRARFGHNGGPDLI